MDVIALVGPSGTGKSHRALVIAHKHKADAIIDDGILISDGKIIAGHSAKQETSKIMAVRRAIFILPGHAEEVRKAIGEVNPHRILVLGYREGAVLPAQAGEAHHSCAHHRAEAAFLRLSH